jgi:ABC-type glycerol-3-phosphate transport system substrate-binding protein
MVPDAPNWDDYSNNLCYLNGTCAMIQNSGSVYAAMKDNDPKLLENTLIVASPGGPEGKASFTNWSQWDMNAKSQNPELAKKFLAWNMSPENQGDYMRMWGGQVFPLYNDLAKDPMWEDPYLKGFMENSLVTHTAGWPGPNTLWAQEAMKQHVLPAMVNRIVVEDWPIEKAVDEAVQKLEDIYKALQ